MTKKTLVEVFGTGASQTANDLTISKTALADTDLTVAETNEAADLFVAIVKGAAVAFNETSRDADFDVSVSIDLQDGLDFVSRTVGNVTKTYVRKTITIELDEEYTSTGINPNVY